MERQKVRTQSCVFREQAGARGENPKLDSQVRTSGGGTEPEMDWLPLDQAQAGCVVKRDVLAGRCREAGTSQQGAGGGM